MMLSKLKNAIFWKSSQKWKADQLRIQELTERMQELENELFNYERLVIAYQHIIPLDTTVQMLCFYQAKDRFFMTIRDGGNHLRFLLFCPALQIQQADHHAGVRPLAELFVSINYGCANIDELKVHKKSYGLTLLSSAFPELRKKQCQTISGKFSIPDGEEQRIRNFFNLALIGILVKDNMLYIAESEFSRRPAIK